MNSRNRCLLLLAFCLLLVLNYPWLAVFAKQTLVFGLPMLHLYLFALWSVIILTVAVLMATEEDEGTSSIEAGRSVGKTDNAAK